MLTLTACSGTNTDSSSTMQNTGESTSTAQKTVTLSVMTSDRFLELAKQQYEQAHPNVKIDIKEYVALAQPQPAPSPGPGGAGARQQTTVMANKPDPKNIEKYVSTVGAELMSGKASDIIFTSGLPYKKYADKKLLENISDLMSKDSSFQSNQYYTNIFDAMKYKGALYTIPVKIGLNMWLGNQSVLSADKIDDGKWTWTDFKKAAAGWMKDNNNDGKPDMYPLGKIESDQLITFMLNSSFSKFVDMGSKKAKFDSPEFIAMLKLAKSMYDEKIISADNADTNVVFLPKANTLAYLDMYSLPKTFFDGKGSYYDLPSENDVRGTQFTSPMPVAINSKSANKKEAWDFVKFLLSDHMQSARELAGFAVNKNGAKAQEDFLRTLGTGEGGGQPKIRMNVNGKELAMQPATDQDIALIEKMVNNAKVYMESDPKITSIVSEETGPFFQGQKQAEEVAKVIQNKVSTYLQE
jgi:multiple sugar transport system substrate-binding protein